MTTQKEYPNKFRKIILPCFAVAMFIICWLLSGCNTPKRAARIYDNHPKQGAEYCQSRYPITPVTITTEKIIKGNPDTVETPGSTMYVDCDSAIAATLDEASRKHVAVRCPPVIIVHETDTLRIHDSTTVLDTRQSEIDKMALIGSRNEIDKYKSSAEGRLKWAIGGWFVAAVIILIGVLLRKAKI